MWRTDPAPSSGSPGLLLKRDDERVRDSSSSMDMCSACLRRRRRRRCAPSYASPSSSQVSLVATGAASVVVVATELIVGTTGMVASVATGIVVSATVVVAVGVVVSATVFAAIVVGAIVGAIVGAAVGGIVGAAVGAIVGAAVGAIVGAAVGAIVGAAVGAIVVVTSVVAANNVVVGGEASIPSATINSLTNSDSMTAQQVAATRLAQSDLMHTRSLAFGSLPSLQRKRAMSGEQSPNDSDSSASPSTECIRLVLAACVFSDKKITNTKDSSTGCAMTSDGPMD